jgi:hypothetical protein
MRNCKWCVRRYFGGGTEEPHIISENLFAYTAAHKIKGLLSIRQKILYLCCELSIEQVGLGSNASFFKFWRCLVQISDRTLTILAEDFMVFLSAFKHMTEWYLEVGHDCFSPHSSQFFLH